jgi:hypothetical protein
MSENAQNASRKASTPTQPRLAPAGIASAAVSVPALNRRVFLQSSAGAAAGAVGLATGPRLASAVLGAPTSSEAARVATKPSGPPPRETVMAYIRDAERSEVTVLSGTRETTYRDPILVKQLLDASR